MTILSELLKFLLTLKNKIMFMKNIDADTIHRF